MFKLELRNGKKEGEVMEKNCVNCKNCYIKDGCYLICEIDGIQNDVVENCENFEVDPELYKQALREIKSIAQNLYYQSIKDPVRREKATYDIIEKVNGILEE